MGTRAGRVPGRRPLIHGEAVPRALLAGVLPSGKAPSCGPSPWRPCVAFTAPSGPHQRRQRYAITHRQTQRTAAPVAAAPSQGGGGNRFFH